MAKQRDTSKLLIINGEQMPYPDMGMEIQEITNVDGARNAHGTVVGQKVGRNIWKINNLQWSSLTPKEWQKIKKAIAPFFVKVTFTADDNQRHTVTMYPGDRSSKPFMVSGLSYQRFMECKFNLIDCGKMTGSGGEM